MDIYGLLTTCNLEHKVELQSTNVNHETTIDNGANELMQNYVKHITVYLDNNKHHRDDKSSGLLLTLELLAESNSP